MGSHAAQAGRRWLCSRVSSAAVPSEELPLDLGFDEHVPSRGFLRVDLDGGLPVFAVHWKSSRGESCTAEDMDNARQRENQAAGLAAGARDAPTGGNTVVIAGDLNVQAPGRHLRVGTDPVEDCAPRGTCEGACGRNGLDGYDDSISALLTLPGARLLSADLPETYVAEFFPGGANDHILVVGPRAEEFGEAATSYVEGTSYLGSDDRPVTATVPQQ